MTARSALASEVLHGSSPVIGAPAEAEAAARVLGRMRDDIETLDVRAGQSLLFLNPMRSAAVVEVREAIVGRLLPGARRLMRDLASATRAFDAYADEIARIHAAARATCDEAEQLLARVRVCAIEIESASSLLGLGGSRWSSQRWDERPPLWPPVGEDALDALGVLAHGELLRRAEATTLWCSAAAAWGRAADGLVAARERWERLRSDRVQAEQALVAVLGATELGSLIRHGAAPEAYAVSAVFAGGLGRTDPASAAPRLGALLEGRLTPSEAADRWSADGLSERELDRAPIGTLVALASADGIPLDLRERASRAVLAFALTHPETVYRLLGLGATDLSIETFSAQLVALNGALQQAEGRSRALPGPGPHVVQLLGLGVHDGALTAAVSIGSAASAESVAVNVPGMGSSLSGIDNGLRGAEQLYRAAYRADASASISVITWVGYHAPAMPPSIEVLAPGRAESGAAPLAGFLDGLEAARAHGAAPEPREFVVLAHSYGSTTAAEALTMTEARVDALVTYGSAGLEPDAGIESIRAEKVYATQAVGDQVAGIGRGGSGRLNPIGMPGVIEFSAEASETGRRVTAHDMYVEHDGPSAMNWGGKTGYLSAGATSLESMGRILVGGRP
ncbi:MAG: hypothetical protein KDB25_04630 [Leucobacter sp.]|nr:hypothetical protein [Leucobacter sp.]